MLKNLIRNWSSFQVRFGALEIELDQLGFWFPLEDSIFAFSKIIEAPDYNFSSGIIGLVCII